MVAEAPPAPRPFAPQHIGRDLQLGTQDVGRGIANIAGTPFDLTNGFINALLTGADKVAELFGGNVDYRLPVQASEKFRQGASTVATALGAPPIPWEERSDREKMTGNMIDFGTQAAGTGAGLLRAAIKRAPEIAAGAEKKISDAFVRPYIENPGRTLAGDTAAGLGSGVGVTAAEEYAPDSPWLKALGVLGGGFAGSSALELGQGATRAASDLTRPVTFRTHEAGLPVDPATNMPVRRTDAETAARMLQEVTRDPMTGVSRAPAAARNIAERAEEFRGADLPVPTSGLLSDNAGLYAAEAAARGQGNIPFAERDAQVKAAAGNRAASIRDPGADQSAVTGRAQGYRDEQLAPVQADIEAARAADEAARANREGQGAPLSLVRGSDTRANASRTLDKSIVEDRYLPDRRTKNELYKAIDPEGTAMRDTSSLAAAVERVRAAEAALPESMRTRSPILDDIANLVDPATGQARQIAFRDLETMRMKLSRSAREAREGGSPNFDLADAYDQIRAAIGREAKQMAEEGGPAGERARAARENYVQNFAPRYRAGPGDEMTGFTRSIDKDPTRSTTPPSATAGRFLTAPEKAASLRRVLDGSPSEAEGNAAVRDYLMSDYAASVLNPDGTVNARRAHLWASNNAAVLEQFPVLRAEFDRMAASARSGETTSLAARTALRDAVERGQITERDIERSVVGTLLKEDPRDVAKSIFRGGANYGAEKRLDEVAKVIGSDQAAKRGWKAAVAEVITDEITHLTKLDGRNDAFRLQLGKLEDVFQKYATQLAKVFSPGEMNTLRQAHALLEPLQNAAARAAGITDPAARAEQLWRLAEVGLKAKFGILKGGGMLRTLRIATAAMPSSSNNVQRLIQRAFFDPEIAEYLLTRKVRNLDYEASNKYVRRLLAASELARESSDEETPNDN